MHNDFNIKDVKHKIIFFFMPESIVFETVKDNDDVDLAALKAISPCFYWCSAHEFPGIKSKNKYLFQYQIYSIDAYKIIPGEIYQQWYSNKNQIRSDIISFIEFWDDHKRLLMAPEDLEPNDKNITSYNKIYNFSEFASFVGKSIFKLQPIYKEQISLVNFDSLQKDYWKMIALNNAEINGNYNTVLKTNKTKIKKKLSPKKKEKIKNNETKRNTIK